VDPDKFWTVCRSSKNGKEALCGGADIGFLREAEVMVGQGKSIAEVLREIGVTANTYLYFTRHSFVPGG
jgi:hypothetical protein